MLLNMESFWLVGAGGSSVVTDLGQLREVLLTQREVVRGEREYFFEPSFDRGIHDPALLFGMDVAVERIRQAIRKEERVVVYGDYDADGVASLAILMTALKGLGANVSPFLPHRVDDGYGLNLSVLKKLASEMDLLITVDCGVSNVAEIDWLGRRGIDVIVTDHHNLPGDLPEALAVLHPRHPQGKYPFKYLCGAGVAWKLAAALLADKEAEINLLDLVAVGTVADMVPMVGENRVIVALGLRVLRKSSRVGMRALTAMVGEGAGDVDEEALSYRLVPLLNAAGRLEHAQPVLDLMLTDNKSQADGLVAKLQQYNRRRSVRSRQIQAEVESKLREDKAPFVFVSDKSWEAGLVGLVAGRLSDKYAKMAVVVGGGNGHAVGSARAPAGFNVFQLIAGQEKHLLSFGGHAAAAGFSVAYDKVSMLRSLLLEAAAQMGEETKCRTEAADAVVVRDLLNWDTAEMLGRFAPFGEGNRRPGLISRDLELMEWRVVGKTGEHAKFLFRNGDELLDGIGFGLARQEWLRGVKKAKLVDVLFHLDINEFRGRRTLQLQVLDIAAAGGVKIVTGN